MQKHFIIMASLFVCACSSKKIEEAQTSETKTTTANTNIVSLTAEQVKNANISIGKPELQYISSSLKVSGQVDVAPENLVTVSVPMGGYLQSTRLLPGMYVRKGQPIATVQDQQYIQIQQDYLTARARLAYLEKEYERQRDLNQSKATSDKQYQQTEADYRTQQAMVRGLQEKLRLINISPERLNAAAISRSISIYAPISGYVSKVNVSVGKYVNPADVLFEIINPNNIHLSLRVYEKDVNKLQAGQRVLAYTNTNPRKKYNCKISLITQDVSSDRSAEVHCHFEQYDKDLMPGMFMNAEIEQTNHQAYVLSEEAIVNYENNTYVFLSKENNQFEMIPVETGIVQDEQVELKPNTTKNFFQNSFVTKGAYTLLMKLKNTAEE